MNCCLEKIEKDDSERSLTSILKFSSNLWWILDSIFHDLKRWWLMSESQDTHGKRYSVFEAMIFTIVFCIWIKAWMSCLSHEWYFLPGCPCSILQRKTMEKWDEVEDFVFQFQSVNWRSQSVADHHTPRSVVTKKTRIQTWRYVDCLLSIIFISSSHIMRIFCLDLSKINVYSWAIFMAERKVMTITFSVLGVLQRIGHNQF